MCWMTLPEVHPIAHTTSCQEYCKCKQIEFIIDVYAYANLLYDRPFQVELCHHIITSYSWLFKQSYLEITQFM